MSDYETALQIASLRNVHKLCLCAGLAAVFVWVSYVAYLIVSNAALPDSDDLLDRRRISWVSLAFVARSFPGAEPGHGCRRTSATGDVERLLSSRHGSLL